MTTTLDTILNLNPMVVEDSTKIKEKYLANRERILAKKRENYKAAVLKRAVLEEALKKILEELPADIIIEGTNKIDLKSKHCKFTYTIKYKK